jgi:hypothetical protein
MWDIFEPSLRTIRDLIRDQILTALAKSIMVDSIVVIGGFGDSPALRDYLRLWLNTLNRNSGLDIGMKFTLPYVVY